MIERLKEKNLIDVYDFLEKNEDSFEDFYITKEKQRIFLKKNWSLIKKILKYHECYGLFDKELKGIIIIVKDKGFRPYVKLLAENKKYIIDLLKYLKWNFLEQDLYMKLKINNPLVEQIKKTGFLKIGMRGKEILFFKRRIKQLYPLIPKDNYLIDNEKRLY